MIPVHKHRDWSAAQTNEAGMTGKCVPQGKGSEAGIGVPLEKQVHPSTNRASPVSSKLFTLFPF